MLNIGDRAPSFELPDDVGGVFRLSDALQLGPLVIYFYPKDFTNVCTREAAMFREEHHRLAERGIRVFGISPQTSECHGRFRSHMKLPFQLLADPEKKVIAAYDALGLFGWAVRRITYFVGKNGLIQDRCRAEFRVSCHKDLVRRVVTALS